MTPNDLNAIERGALANHCKAVFLSKKMGGTEGKDVREVADDMICTIEHLAKEMRACWRRESRTEPVLVAKSIPISTIIEAVCAHYGVSLEALKGIGRGCRNLITARHVGYWLAHEWAGKTSTITGRHFGKDHTTILHGCRAIALRLSRNEERLRDDIELIQMRISERLEQPKEAVG